MKKLLILCFAVLLAVSVSSYAGGPGTTAAQFLKIEPSARPMAMGGAYSAVVEDSNAVFFNPAGLAGIEQREMAGTYLRYFQAINYGSLSGAMKFKENSAVGLGIKYLGVTDIERRGTADTSDPTGTASVDTFGAMDTALAVSYAVRNPFPSVLENLDAGANLKFTYQTIDEESAFSAMADLGALYPVNEKVKIALVVQNIGMNVKFKDESDPLPVNIKAGGAYKPIDSLTIAADLNEYIIDEILYASIGAEYWIKEIVALRGGYKYGYDTDSLGSSVGLSGGVGFRYSGLGLDYAFAPFGELGDTHRVSFIVQF